MNFQMGELFSGSRGIFSTSKIELMNRQSMDGVKEPLSSLSCEFVNNPSSLITPLSFKPPSGVSRIKKGLIELYGNQLPNGTKGSESI